jgi:RHS repeat-associated protein
MSHWGCGPCSYDFTSARLDDGIYRLTNETITLDPHSKNGAVNYGLDPVGNRLSQDSTIPGISTGAATFDANDRLSTETYDNNGNTLTSGGKTFAYDFENRLKSMSGGAVMQYDGDGNRVSKTVGGVTTRYLVDDLNPTGYAQVVEELANGALQRVYTYGSQRISLNQLVNSTWTPSFYGYDGAGTVRTLADTTGTVTDTYDYDAWGNAVNTTGSTPNVYLYRGEQYDPDLGLYYLRARYFNPVTGRFLARDPADGRTTDPRTLHKYLYAAANPINLADPTGRSIGGTLVLGELSVPGAIALGAAATLTLVCYGQPLGAFLMAAGLAASGAEVSNPKVWGSAICPIYVTFDWERLKKKVEDLPWPKEIPPPGDCTPERLRELMALQDLACPKGIDTPCSGKEPPALGNAKALAKAACANARMLVMTECFEGGNQGHQWVVETLMIQAAACVGVELIEK